jgi:hypothetical protein
MKCRQGWAEQTEAQPKPVTVRLLGHDVELTCVCAFTRRDDVPTLDTIGRALASSD